MRRVRKRIVSEQGGFTLVELLTASVVGIVVLGVAFGLLDSTIRAFGASEQRTDVAQRGRLAIDQVTRQLRSPVCVEANGANAFLIAEPTRVRYWSDLSGSDFGVGSTQPVVRELSLEGGALRERVRATPAGSIQSDRVLVTGITSSRLFTYYALTPQSPGGGSRTATAELAATVPAGDLSRIARIGVAFESQPTDPANAKSAARFENDVYIRSINHGEADGGIRCVAA